LTEPGSQTAPGGALVARATSATRSMAVSMLALVAVLTVGVDLATKQLVLGTLGDGSVVRILGGAVYFDLTRNGGAAFSIGTGMTVVFPIVATAVIIGIVWLGRKLRSVPWAIALGLIMGGAAGNLIDRLFRAPAPFRGQVVDFISLFGPYGERFAIFNAADSALCIGVALAILLEFTGRRRDGAPADVRKPGTKRSA
jgi:signal peptidase II